MLFSTLMFPRVTVYCDSGEYRNLVGVKSRGAMTCLIGPKPTRVEQLASIQISTVGFRPLRSGGDRRILTRSPQTAALPGLLAVLETRGSVIRRLCPARPGFGWIVSS